MLASRALNLPAAPVVPLRHFGMQATIAQLVESGLRGEPAALRELYDRHARAALARALRLLGSSTTFVGGQQSFQEGFLGHVFGLHHAQHPS